MVILRFDLLFDLVTYLFDLWPQNNDMSYTYVIYSAEVAITDMLISQLVFVKTWIPGHI